MKKLSLILTLLLVVLGMAGSASAQCQPTWYGPYNFFPAPYYVVALDPNCFSLTTNVSSSTVSCSYTSGWQFGGGWSESASTYFTISSTDPSIDPSSWEVSAFVEASSPGGSWYDQIAINVTVHHQNGTNSYYTPFSWNGTQGSLNGCQQQYGLFTADHGDTVTVEVRTTNLTGATLRASVPMLFVNAR